MSLQRCISHICDIRGSRKDMKIAFHLMGGEAWAAGSVYLANLFYALRMTCGEGIGLYVLHERTRHQTQGHENGLKADGLLVCDQPRRWTPAWAVDRLFRRIALRDLPLETVLKRHGMDALFGSALQSRYDQIAALSWLPDFQHVHLPHMFSEEERRSRDRNFRRSARLATRVVLLSVTSKRDFNTFAPEYSHKAVALPPVCNIPDVVYEEGIDSILRLYSLPDKFIYLPNQFWKHKNHETVFHAVRLLKRSGTNIIVVCSGSPIDYRHPGYFANAWRQISELGVRDQVIYLGMIPRDHVMLLMRHSVCVLNPSLFEGWGMTADEARSIGKKTILSDIPAHREQRIPRATFFDPLNPDELAEKLARTWVETRPGPDFELESHAREELPKRLQSYAESFLSIAREAIEEVRSK